MAVVLSKYRENEYMVVANGKLKCKHKTESKARRFAGELASPDDYADETEQKKKAKKGK